MGLRCNGRLRRERNHAIRTAVILHGGDQVKAAAYLGIARSTVAASLATEPNPWITNFDVERQWFEWELELENKLMADEAELLQRLLLAAIKRRE